MFDEVFVTHSKKQTEELYADQVVWMWSRGMSHNESEYYESYIIIYESLKRVEYVMNKKN